MACLTRDNSRSCNKRQRKFFCCFKMNSGKVIMKRSMFTCRVWYKKKKFFNVEDVSPYELINHKCSETIQPLAVTSVGYFQSIRLIPRSPKKTDNFLSKKFFHFLCRDRWNRKKVSFSNVLVSFCLCFFPFQLTNINKYWNWLRDTS